MTMAKMTNKQMLINKIWLHRICWTLLAPMTLYSCPSFADVVTDGTVGPAETLSGPNYVIDSSLGTSKGSNLFHSFSQFSVPYNESATFTGPANIGRIFARVTGGEATQVDGILTSAIPSADLFLINPAGIVMSKTAQVNVDGALFLSNADHIKMNDGGIYSATHPNQSILTIGDPTRFGFLDSNQPNRQVKISGEITVADGKSVQIVGIDDVQLVDAAINTTGGNISAVAIDGDSTIPINGDTDFTDQAYAPLTLNRSTLTTTSDIHHGAGEIYLRGSHFVSSSSKVSSETAGSYAAGSIQITADDVRLTATTIRSDQRDPATGDGADVYLHSTGSGGIVLYGSRIESVANDPEKAGRINIKTDENYIKVQYNSFIEHGAYYDLASAMAIDSSSTIGSLTPFRYSYNPVAGLYIVYGYLDPDSVKPPSDPTEPEHDPDLGGGDPDVGSGPESSGQHIATDGTTGALETLVGPVYTIAEDLGTRVGANLFHSFSYFNLDLNETAIFTGNNTISNIFARITDGNSSSIAGLVKSDIQDANVFLFNPAGIVLHEASVIDVDGSFTLSTADLVNFGDGAIFSASHPDTSILTDADPESFGFLGVASDISLQGTIKPGQGDDINIIAGPISLDYADISSVDGDIRMVSTQGYSVINLSSDPDYEHTYSDISINSSKLESHGEKAGSITLIGDSITLDRTDTIINATGISDGNMIKVYGDSILLDNASRISSIMQEGSAGNGADIQLSSNRLQISGNSIITNVTASEANTGYTSLNATYEIILDGGAIEHAASDYIGSGDTGHISLHAPTIVMDGLQDFDGDVTTFSGHITQSANSSDTGNITLVGNDIVLSGSDSATKVYGTISNASNSGTGGSIGLNAKRIDSTGMFIIETKTETGYSGDISIHASDYAAFSAREGTDITTSKNNKNLVRTVSNTGSSGSIYLQTPSLNLSGNGTSLEINKPGRMGSSGNILIDVSDITISKASVKADAGISEDDVGGNIEINADYINMNSDSSLYTSRIYNSEYTGDVLINTKQLSVENSSLSSGGSLELLAQDISLFRSSIASNIANDIDGDNNLKVVSSVIALDDSTITNESYYGIVEGTVSLQAEHILLANSSKIDNSLDRVDVVNGQVWIDADILELDTRSKITSTIYNAYSVSDNDVGAIKIRSRYTTLSNNSAITGEIIGMHENSIAPDIELETERLLLHDSIITSNTSSKSDGGDILIHANDISMTGMSMITSDTEYFKMFTACAGTYCIGGGIYGYTGNAGNIEIDASSLTMDSQNAFSAPIISSSSATLANAGNIHISAEQLVMNGNASISTSIQQETSLTNFTDYEGGVRNFSAGSIQIDANIMQLNGRNYYTFASDEHAASFYDDNISSTTYQENEYSDPLYASPGSIELNAEEISIAYGFGISTNANMPTILPDNVGNITLSANRILIDGGSDAITNYGYSKIVSNSNNISAPAGDIYLNAEELRLINGGQIQAISNGGLSGGRINIGTDSLIIQGSLDYYYAYYMQQEIIPLLMYENVLYSGHDTSFSGIYSDVMSGTGNGGQVHIVSEFASLSEQGVIRSDNYGSGEGGFINILADQMFMDGDSVLSTNAFYTGNAGSISITGERANIVHSSISSASYDEGDAGNIFINTSKSIVLDQAEITTYAAFAGGGSITLNTVNRFDMNKSFITASVFGGTGNAGVISIDPNLVTIQNSNIFAQAYYGNGGTINITGNAILIDADTEINSSSLFGVDGEVYLDGKVINAGNLEDLDSSYLQGIEILQARCSASRVYGSNTLISKTTYNPGPGSSSYLASTLDINSQMGGVPLPSIPAQSSSVSSNRIVAMCN